MKTTNKFSLTEILMILFAILLIIEEFTSNLEAFFGISIVVAFWCGCLFIGYTVKYFYLTYTLDKENENENHRFFTLNNAVQNGLLGIEATIFSVLHLIVCGCGQFIINVIPMAILFIMVEIVYHKIIKNEIREKTFTMKKFILYIFVYILMIIAACVVGNATYIHKSNIVAAE